MYLSYKLGYEASGDSLIAYISARSYAPSFDLEEVHIYVYFYDLKACPSKGGYGMIFILITVPNTKQNWTPVSIELLIDLPRL